MYTCTRVNVYMYMYLYMYAGKCIHVSAYSQGIHVGTSVLLISLYGAPLSQRASYLALHSSLFGPVAQLIMIILSLTALTLC